ncbi:hypothetical protein ACSU1G_13380 [Microbacterium sp. A93]
MLEKPSDFPIEEVIFDLEDFVARSAGSESRLNILAALSLNGLGYKTLVLRVKHVSSPWVR